VYLNIYFNAIPIFFFEDAPLEESCVKGETQNSSLYFIASDRTSEIYN
jgi:hypothetical protein